MEDIFQIVRKNKSQISSWRKTIAVYQSGFYSEFYIAKEADPDDSGASKLFKEISSSSLHHCEGWKARLKVKQCPKPYPVLPDEETAAAVTTLPKPGPWPWNYCWGCTVKAHCLCHLDPWKWKLHVEPDSPCSSLPIHSMKVKYTHPNGEGGWEFEFDE